MLLTPSLSLFCTTAETLKVAFLVDLGVEVFLVPLLAPLVRGVEGEAHGEGHLVHLVLLLVQLPLLTLLLLQTGAVPLEGCGHVWRGVGLPAVADRGDHSLDTRLLGTQLLAGVGTYINTDVYTELIIHDGLVQ